MKALDNNRFYIKFMQLEIGLLKEFDNVISLYEKLL